MTEVRTIEAQLELLPRASCVSTESQPALPLCFDARFSENQFPLFGTRSEDSIDVIAGGPGGGGRPWPSDPPPKSSFEIAWDLAH